MMTDDGAVTSLSPSSPAAVTSPPSIRLIQQNMSLSHNSSSSSDDSMPRHLKSMLHETFDKESDAKLYEYLLHIDADTESLPELADVSITTPSACSSSRIVSMESPVQQQQQTSVTSTRRRRRQRFGWTPSPIAKRETSSASMNNSPLSPYLKRQDQDHEDSHVKRQVETLKRQLQQAHEQDLYKAREDAATRFEQQQQVYEEKLQQLEKQHLLELQQHDVYAEELDEETTTA